MDTNVIVLSFHSPAALEPCERRSCWVATQTIGRGVNESHLPDLTARPAMIRITRLPEEVTRLRAPLKPALSDRHYWVFCWLWVAHLVCFEQATLPGLARSTPRPIAAWHLRRLLAAGRWPGAQVLEWLVSQALSVFPPRRAGVR